MRIIASSLRKSLFAVSISIFGLSIPSVVSLGAFGQSDPSKRVASQSTLLRDARRFAEISQEMRDEDPRLNAPVPLFLESRLTINDTLARLSKETGVEIDLARPSSGAGSTQLCVLLRHTKLSNVLNGLISLMSYRKAPWHCTRSMGADGHYHYTLIPSSGIDTMVADVYDRIHKQFKAEGPTLRAALAMSPDEMRDAAKTDSDVDGLVPHDGYPQVSQRKRASLSGFFSLPSATQDQLLSSSTQVTVPYGDLPADMRAWVDSEVALNGSHSNGPPKVTFMTQGALGMTPALLVGIAGGGLYNCIGSGAREQEWSDNIAGLWKLPNDESTPSDLGEKKLKSPIPALPFVPNFEPDPDATLESLLWKTAECTPISILAVLPLRTLPADAATSNGVVVGGGPLPANPYGKTLSAVLADVEHSFHSRSKWRDGILLVSDPSAPFYDGPQPVRK